MSRDDPTRELSHLEEACDRVAANLVELELDSSRQLLDVSALTGRSADRWARASAALTDLWRWQGQLKQLVERAEKLRGPWRANELRSLLDGESIELTRSEVPLAQRDLLGSSEITVRCTPEQLLARMSGAFDEVKTVVAGFGEAWGALTPRVTAAQEALEQTDALAAGLGEAHRRDLDDAARETARLATSASSDPLATAPGELDRLIGSLHEIRRDLDATATLRHDFDAHLDAARALLADLDTAAREGRAAHEEAVLKVSLPAAPELPELAYDDLGAELDEIAKLARAGAWRDARSKLDAWTSRTEALLVGARRAAHANRAPVEARNQFRALLEAYQVKARRLGVVEDPELEQTFARAHEALYTAPTDLALVAQLVRRYQELIGSAQEVPR
ncbi:MAG: hypothetical protein ACLP0L_23130 [Solirubrobacteraceae bacterium]